ncbi:outer membrane protein with beta-barrel domain [Novosphingobium sp. PhB57]|uniref:outer membrane beta-barrel protein n=1 Tax=Novosphingobium sp. PhB57 TaxID=2485107 RepID=UPI001052B543|nr:outer membrane beta-barrel protein [Novosphingobium sp. PhB57]TCU54882.1 outer membrane protein with beta-barrel domain [Novosphingobium sp. PhB57]
MRSAAVPFALLLMLAGTPAWADEAYVEVTGGVNWNDEETDAITGVALGYDVDLNETFFVGVEGTAEKLLTDGTRVAWGIGGRAGAEVLPQSKVFVGLNWQSKDCRDCGNAVGLGTGWEQNLTEKLYAKVEFKHLFVGNGEPNANVGILGLGVMF